jgi:hypothetical protein
MNIMKNFNLFYIIISGCIYVLFFIFRVHLIVLCNEFIMVFMHLHISYCNILNSQCWAIELGVSPRQQLHNIASDFKA